MPKLPVVSGKDCVKALQRAGFVVSRQSGSHVIMKRENPKARADVPNHKEIRHGTLRAILKQAGLTVEEFMNLLD
jgi:predicted RNA binding protein YcfA (HicA-like mRNA interferase family)